MTLPETVWLCDAVELAAITLGKPLFSKDLTKQFFPGQAHGDTEADIKDAYELAQTRLAAASDAYPFEVTSHSITFKQPAGFDIYTFLLLGRSLDFGGPTDRDVLLREFRKFFEDAVGWAFRKAGLAAEVLSEPRDFRGLNRQLAPALREISARFQEAAILRDEHLVPQDNDLDVDILAAPIIGNGSRGGWPSFQIQCATGVVKHLHSKLSEGAKTFGTVWDDGFFPGCRVRAVATPDDLLLLAKQHWLRLGQDGWVLDRTRIAHLSRSQRNVPILPELQAYWNDLWRARQEIDWETGWQQTT